MEKAEEHGTSHYGACGYWLYSCLANLDAFGIRSARYLQASPSGIGEDIQMYCMRLGSRHCIAPTGRRGMDQNRRRIKKAKPWHQAANSQNPLCHMCNLRDSVQFCAQRQKIRGRPRLTRAAADHVGVTDLQVSYGSAA